MTDQTRQGSSAPTGGGTDGIEGLRILCVDDDDQLLLALCRLLQASGASVASAHDGLEATERALAETFDLVVMDLRMPRMDGFEAARALRAGGCRVPLVAVTGDDTPEARANALAAGFDAVLPKPFGLENLIDALQIAREGQPAQTGVVSRAARPDSRPP